jgi:hypothetical protein
MDNEIDIETFNEAFDECYRTFLSRQVEDGSYLQHTMNELSEDIRLKMEKAVARLQKGHTLKRDNLIDIVLCGIEILSIQ